MPLLFLQAPGLGDDLSYWQLGFELHEQGWQAWDDGSFHDLRWPVWGVSWLLQAITGPGLIGYYGVPMLYCALGAWLVFRFGRLIYRAEALALLGATLFLFHPLLNPIVYRPMPDLSEGVLGALAMWCWYALMTREKRRAGWAIATGLLIAVMYSNRLTGLFIAPTIALCTLLVFPRRWPWLLAVAAAAAGFAALEGLIYWHATGDFLHSLHANLGAKGRKGTESTALWSLPFRFLDSLWKGGPLAPVYAITAVLGIVKSWRDFGQPGRAVVAWFVTIFLSYSCALQGLDPVRPMLRDADRFLVGCAAPMALLSAAGWLWLWEIAIRWERPRRVLWLARDHSRTAAVAVLLLLIAFSGRPMLDLGYMPAFRRYVGALEPGTKVFSHHSMRALSFLVAPAGSARLEWKTKHWIVEADEDLETKAANSDEIWFTRKLAWLGVRKALERDQREGKVIYTSYIREPEKEWRLAEVISRDNNPDFIFWKRRDPQTATPQWTNWPLPASGVEWNKGDDRRPALTLPVPPDMVGKRIYLRLQARASEVEAVDASLLLYGDDRLLGSYVLKPYLQEFKGTDYFALAIPEGTDRAELKLNISRKAKSIILDQIETLTF